MLWTGSSCSIKACWWACAGSALSVAALLSSEDFVSPKCDELSRMTYIAAFKKYYQQNQAAIEARLASGSSGAPISKAVDDSKAKE